MSTIETLITELKSRLTPAAREQLDAVIRSPEAERLFEREAAELHAERTELAQRLAGLPKMYAGQHAAATKACAAAAERETEATDALAIAQTALRDARCAADALVAEERRIRWDAERALRETADPRLQAFVEWCDDRSSLARAAWACRLEAGPRSWLSGERGAATWASNEAQVVAARTALQAAETWAHGAQLEVLDRQEVTDQLNARLHQLAPVLEALQLMNAELDQHGNIVFDRTKKPGETIRDATLASGFAPEATPAAESSARRQRVLARLGA